MAPEARPAIPAELKRRVRVEAGHRCAIPTCRGTSALELAHITPWAQVQEHAFDNLILLCAVDHHRYDQGEIDRRSMLQYKANLGVLNARYGEIERRVIEAFAGEPAADYIDLPWGFDLLMKYLQQDGLFVRRTSPNNDMNLGGRVAIEAYYITETGREFVRSWIGAAALD